MPATSNRADLLPAEWSILYLLGIALILGSCWFLAQRFRRHVPINGLAQPFAFLLRTVIASTTLWAVFQIIARPVYLATPWPLVTVAIIAAIAIEFTLLLYRREQAILPPKQARLLAALRVAALLTLTLILLQPILALESQRRLRREIVILLDDSASMQLADKQLTTSEKLKIATLFGVAAAERKSTLTDVQRGLQLLDNQLAAEARALEPPSGVSDAAASSLISRRTADLEQLLEETRDRLRKFAEIVADSRNHTDDADSPALEKIEERIRQNITRSLNEAADRLADANYAATLGEIQSASRQIDYVLEQLPATIVVTDQRFYQSLSPSDRKEIDRTTSLTRSAIALRALEQDDFITMLGNQYQLRFIRFGHSPESFDAEAWFENARTAHTEDSFRRATDLTTALESIIADIPQGNLAGILLLSDGRHNGERPIDDVARRLGLQQAPVCSIVIGSSLGPRDAGILDVRVPDTIHLDDRAIIQTDVKLDGLVGETVTVSLLKGDQLIDFRELEVNEASLRTTISFADTPDLIGISQYTVRISAAADETFKENNRWDFEVAVTDDRTNVLIIESYPRWEFRYLRNLFHARDKSVHLQYVLLNPDEIADSPPPPELAASADRKFGESEATALPTSREEWLKFDAIILGDIPPGAIDETTWGHIQHCVSERASLLVTIAGQRFMPLAHTSPILRELLPVTYDADAPSAHAPYRLRLTLAGRNSLIMQQSLDPNLNQMVWGGLPPLNWRGPITGIKPGAEVLAYAQPLNGNSRLPTQDIRAANALIVTQRYASGKVVALNFDRSWRLRYGVGDVHHHKFWGQLLRWGTGENLRAGNQFIRLGTDKLSYEPGDKIQVTARVSTASNQPLTGGAISASIYQGETQFLRTPLNYRTDSNGIFEAEIPPLPTRGRFRIRLDGDDVNAILRSLGEDKVETEFIVKPSSNAIELSELTAAPEFLAHLAALSGGSIADPDNAPALRNFFAPPGQIIHKREETTLWDNFPLLLFFLAILSSEWIIRRKNGLA
ncbi:MAG: hypothetical protein ACI8XO_002046 [Verrucomicrobiales bacterium]|jgi:hypothetical protein